MTRRLYLLRRRLHYTRRLHRDIATLGYGWRDCWHLAGLNQRVALEVVAEMRAERDAFEQAVLADIAALEVAA